MFSIPSVSSLFSRNVEPSNTITKSLSKSSHTSESSAQPPTLESRCTTQQLQHSRAIVQQILSDRSQDDLVPNTNNRKIGQSTLLRYFPLPGIIGDRFFDVIRTRVTTLVAISTPIPPVPSSSPFSSFRTAIKGHQNKTLSIDSEALFATVALLTWGSILERRCFLFELFDCSGSGRVSQAELEGVLVSGTLRPSIGDGDDGEDINDADAVVGEIKNNNSNSGGSSRFQVKYKDKDDGNQLLTSSQAVDIARTLAEDAFLCHVGIEGSFGIDEFCRWLDSVPEIEHLMFALLSPSFLISQATYVCNTQIRLIPSKICKLPEGISVPDTWIPTTKI